MELANASLLDESTAAAEAMTMLFGARSRTQKKNEACQFFVDENILPQTLSLLYTRATLLVSNWLLEILKTVIFQLPFWSHLSIPRQKRKLTRSKTMDAKSPII